jgi:hypothetical protein
MYKDISILYRIVMDYNFHFFSVLLKDQEIIYFNEEENDAILNKFDARIFLKKNNNLFI